MFLYNCQQHILFFILDVTLEVVIGITRHPDRKFTCPEKNQQYTDIEIPFNHIPMHNFRSKYSENLISEERYCLNLMSINDIQDL